MLSKKATGNLEIIKFEQTESVEFEPNKKDKYKLTLSNNSKIIEFKLIDLISYPNEEYCLQTNLENLQKIDRLFLLFKDLQEVNHNIIRLLQNNNITVNRENNICKLKIKNPINDEECTIELTKKEGETKELSRQEKKEYAPSFNELKKRVEDLEEKNSNLEQKNIELEKKIQILEEKFEKIGKNVEKPVEIVKVRTTEPEESIEDDVIIFKSNIIDKKQEKIIKEFIENKIMSAELIFDTSKDGDNTEAFKNKCTGQNPTLIIIKTDTGIVFGGYATVPWKEGGPIQDYQSFVFSFNPKKKYKVTVPKFALYGYSEKDKLLIQFGCTCFRIENNCTKSNNNCVRGTGYEKGILDIIPGEHKFRVSRMEIFKLNF